MTNDLVRASGLWLNDGKRGKFMSGHTSEAIPEGAKLLIFKDESGLCNRLRNIVVFLSLGSRPRGTIKKPCPWRAD